MPWMVAKLGPSKEKTVRRVLYIARNFRVVAGPQGGWSSMADSLRRWEKGISSISTHYARLPLSINLIAACHSPV